MLTIRKYSVVKALLIVGLCLTITMGTFATIIVTPALASGQGAEQMVEKTQEQIEKDTERLRLANMRISHDDWEWGYPIYTLIIRFVGIFVVLGVIMVMMQISGRIFVRIDEKKKAQAAK